MDCKDNLSPQGQAAQILVDFLEVAITSVIFHKGLYPPGAFERRKYMNLVVHKAIHPELQDYIHSSVNGLFPFIKKGVVDRIAVVFFNGDNTPLEQFIFKLQVNQSYGSNVVETDIGFALRSFILKLSLSKGLTKSLPQDCRWEVIAFFRSDAQASGVKAAELWIPTDTKQWQQPPLITPLKSMNSEPFGLQLYLEHPSV
ncbi:DNA polymerase zeta processivity subunit [Silene latifolia]|uniref:DNA polymerase zeta processivity subunit n=1 Tax=Silene latifolia TaxID=37657 RepID=UPI003D789817